MHSAPWTKISSSMSGTCWRISSISSSDSSRERITRVSPCCRQNFTAGPVHRVGLHRQVDIHLGEMLANQHDQAGIGHDQRIRPHGDHRLQVAQEGFQLGVVRGDVDHHVEALAQGMGFVDAGGQIGVVEFVVAHPQAVARLAGVDGVGAVGEGVAHAFQRAGGAEQFRGKRSAGHGNAAGSGKKAATLESPRAARAERGQRIAPEFGTSDVCKSNGLLSATRCQRIPSLQPSPQGEGAVRTG